MYGIREGYTAREQPAYFVDSMPDGKVWQWDAYRIAAHIARVRWCEAIIDIGCGRADKLMRCAGEFRTVGVDVGDNLRFCRETYRNHLWINADLELPSPHLVPLGTARRVVICADVIEHLRNPEPLRDTLAQMAERAAAVVLTTPDRRRVYGYDHDGPPGNVHHAREWTLSEMLHWLPQPVAWAGWTRSNDRDPYKYKQTMLIVLSRLPFVPEMLMGFDLESAR
jgi:hypothetical protein